MIVTSNSTLYIVYYNSMYNAPSPDTSHQKVLQTTKGRSESFQSCSRVVRKSLKKYIAILKCIPVNNNQTRKIRTA